MERRPKVYIETMVPNYVFNDEVPEKQQVSKQLFSLIHRQLFEPFVSSITIGEINKSPEPKRLKVLLGLIFYIISPHLRLFHPRR